MTKKEPTRQEIIEAIKKKNDKAKGYKTNTHFSSDAKNVSTKSNSSSLQRMIPKATLESRVQSLIDNRCRYWIENRISQLLMSDNFTTREGYSFRIDNDRNKAGLCFRFVRNGQTIAKIDGDGYLYCSNVFSGQTNLNALYNMLNNSDSNMSSYVKHSDLKNGEYVLSVDSITTNNEIINNELNMNDLYKWEVINDKLYLLYNNGEDYDEIFTFRKNESHHRRGEAAREAGTGR